MLVTTNMNHFHIFTAFRFLGENWSTNDQLLFFQLENWPLFLSQKYDTFMYIKMYISTKKPHLVKPISKTHTPKKTTEVGQGAARGELS